MSTPRSTPSSQEDARQRDSLRLIASENYASRAVLTATASSLTNKYAEGYPGKRYYEGMDFIDPLESLAIARARELFAAEHANVQPYSGSPANLAALLALCQPGDTIMGLALPAGGHLTHGWKVSATGIYYKAVQYGVRKDDQPHRHGRGPQPRPRAPPEAHLGRSLRVPAQLDFPAFAEIAREVGAYLAADIAHIAGLVAGGAHPSPVPHADVVTTTTHKTLRGPRGGLILCKAQHAAAIDKAVFPGPAGRPAQPRPPPPRPSPSRRPSIPPSTYAHQIVANARALAEALSPAAFASSPAAPTTTSCSSTSPPQPRRPQGRPLPQQLRHRAQRQRDPLRPAQALRPLRPAHRPRRDHLARPAHEHMPAVGG
jgi:glycine hydroxymethyltransferase